MAKKKVKKAKKKIVTPKDAPSIESKGDESAYHPPEVIAEVIKKNMKPITLQVDEIDVFEKDEYIGKEIYTKKFQKGKEIDMTRYEMVRMLFEVVLTYDVEMDDTLGVELGLSSASLPFKLSFNTLINYGIIKEL